MKNDIKSRSKEQKDNVPENIEKHYTDEELVKFCLSHLDFKQDSVLDAGAGKNMVWFNNISSSNKDWSELERGRDFFNYERKVDWIVGNPPYHLCWEFWQHSFKIAQKGVGFLISIHMINKFTPKRLKEIAEQGFYLNKLVVVGCKRWYGRYFFAIFTKENKGFVDWGLQTYQ